MGLAQVLDGHGKETDGLCVGRVAVLVPRLVEGGQVLCHLFLRQTYQSRSGRIVTHNVGGLAHLGIVVPAQHTHTDTEGVSQYKLARPIHDSLTLQYEHLRVIKIPLDL